MTCLCLLFPRLLFSLTFCIFCQGQNVKRRADGGVTWGLVKIDSKRFGFFFEREKNAKMHLSWDMILLNLLRTSGIGGNSLSVANRCFKLVGRLAATQFCIKLPLGTWKSELWKKGAPTHLKEKSVNKVPLLNDDRLLFSSLNLLVRRRDFHCHNFPLWGKNGRKRSESTSLVQKSLATFFSLSY